MCVSVCDVTRGLRVFCLSSDTGTALGWRRARGGADQLAVEAAYSVPSSVRRRLAASQDVCAQRLDRVQPFDLHQAGQEVRDAVARRAHSLEELEAFAHPADLVALQPEALGQMPPGLHHSCLAAVGGAQHAARLLQAVEGKLRGAQACSCKMKVANLHIKPTMGATELFFFFF